MARQPQLGRLNVTLPPAPTKRTKSEYEKRMERWRKLMVREWWWRNNRPPGY